MGIRDDIRQGWRQGLRQAALERCRKLLLQGTVEEFIAFSRDAAGRFPESAEIQLMHARGLRQAERSDCEVAAQATRAARVGARDPNIQVQAGYVLMDARDAEGARECVARAEESGGDQFALAVDLDGLRGRLASADGEFEEAERLFRSVLSREPQWSGNWSQLARFLWSRGRNDEALTVMAESLARLRDDEESPARLRDIESAECLQGEIAGDTRADLGD
ncbi:MAG: tetratricopeptide repeat protein [Actinobacteria bacterium]|nr:tetratricopeptide repeat protein [Actinomycetota bacterium]OJU85806.1 MAG: hypothetical protein BGO11_03710 [Solirubrobacterales bacterium 70-9]